MKTLKNIYNSLDSLLLVEALFPILSALLVYTGLPYVEKQENRDYFIYLLFSIFIFISLLILVKILNLIYLAIKNKHIQKLDFLFILKSIIILGVNFTFIFISSLLLKSLF